MQRMSRVTDKHRGRLMNEAKGSDELMSLLTRAKSHELSEDEKKKLRVLLIDMLKSIPTFVIISLPQRFLTLPILMQILPKNFISDTLNH
jgi:hypothetical protein